MPGTISTVIVDGFQLLTCAGLKDNPHVESWVAEAVCEVLSIPMGTGCNVLMDDIEFLSDEEFDREIAERWIMRHLRPALAKTYSKDKIWPNSRYLNGVKVVEDDIHLTLAVG